MNFIEALSRFTDDIKDVDVSYFESFTVECCDNTFEYQGRTHCKMRHIVKSAQFNSCEKEAKIFSYSSDRYETALKNVINKKITPDHFYLELKSMLDFYLTQKNIKKINSSVFGGVKTHKEMFKALWPLLPDEYWFMGCKFLKADA